MTAHDRRVKAAVLKFARKQYPRERFTGVRHIYPRAYVVARPASGVLVAVTPWPDAEPIVRDLCRAHGARTFTGMEFDSSLRVGDWCSIGYVVTGTGGWSVAIPVVP